VKEDHLVATWDDIVKDAPEFAAKVRRRFEMGTNKTIATLRRDGSPRITAIEAQFTDGEVTMGMMADSLKLRDVRRDPRVALHSPTIEFEVPDPDWPGDAKLAGNAIEMPASPDSEPGTGSFKIDIAEVALTYVGTPADHLVIESWHAGQGWRRQTRA
jgi:Pyridoxamine 5'-phosphate oxidase